MSTRIPLSSQMMRKAPCQARSRATVETILAAGAQVLALVGWPKFTTNQVAETAGLSIGSLYQYFPNKLALIEAITRRHLDDVLSVLRGTDDSKLPLFERVERLVDGMIKIHRINPGLHRVLLQEVPVSDALKSAHALFEQEYLRRYAALFTPDEPVKRLAPNRLAAQVLSAAIAGAVHEAAHRGTLTSLSLRRELIAIAYAYIRDRRPSVPSRGPELESKA